MKFLFGKRTKRYFHREARPLVHITGDPGPLPVTKISGAPWWPAGRPRPVCGACSKPMAFMMQVRLSDVPGLESDNALLSWHFCRDCNPFGPDKALCYSLEFFEPGGEGALDGLGVTADPVMTPYGVQFSSEPEMRSGDPKERFLRVSSQPEAGCRQGVVEEIDESRATVLDSAPAHAPSVAEDETMAGLYRRYSSLADKSHRSKLGGWPTWVQNPAWPLDAAKEPMIFVGQLDFATGGTAALWGGGGYAYLFVSARDRECREAAMVISTT